MATKSANEEEDDFVAHLFSAQAHDYLMFFTNTGRVYVERVYELPEGSRSSKGRSIKNVLNLQPEESVAAMLRLERRVDEDGNDVTFGQDAGFVLFATRTGKVKKTGIYDFRNFRKDGIIAIKLDEGNELIDVRLTTGSNEVVLVTRRGLSLRFQEEQARPMGRTAAGVAGIKPVGDDVLVGLALVSDESTLLVASENGIGKRTSFADYRAQARGGKGIITMKVTEKTGEVVGAIAVEESDELMLMTTSGQSIRIRAAEVRETGRNAQGVKLVTLRGAEKLLDIAKVLSGDEDDKEESGEGGDEEAVEAGADAGDGAESPPESGEADASSEEE
jgi:DNA gyrase subunit A